MPHHFNKIQSHMSFSILLSKNTHSTILFHSMATTLDQAINALCDIMTGSDLCAKQIISGDM